mgnify:CR=1 FL=1
MINQPKIAFLYPGQGAVPEKPLADLYGAEVRFLYEELRPAGCPAYDDFHQAAITNDLAAQLGVFCLSHALAEVLKGDGITPTVVTGYSSGLYAAMAGCGCLTPLQGMAAIKHAYEVIARTNTPQSFLMVAVIGLPVDKVQQQLAAVTGPCWLSLVNNKSQTIVSLARNQFQGFSESCLEAGALRVMQLPFEYPYHGKALRQAGNSLLRFFESMPLAAPQTPIIAGSAPAYINGSAQEVAIQVASQLWQTVHWHETIAELIRRDIDLFVVLDPTNALSRIIRWFNRSIQTRGIGSTDDINRLAASLP